MSEYGGPSMARLEKRRSTGTSDALQYYWSASAGERPSSLSSSLGVSPIDSSPRPGLMTSPYTLSPPTQLHEENSSISLRELVEQEARHEQQQQLHRQHCRGDSTEEDASNYGQYNNMLRNPDMASSAGPSNRRIHLISYSSDSMSALASQPSFNSVTSMRDMDRPSSRSSSRSADSEYSLVEDDATPVESLPPAPLRDISGTRQSRGSNRPRGMMDTEGSLNVLLDPSFEEWAHQRIWDTPTPISPPIVSPQEWRTPTQTEQRDRDFKSSSGGWSSPYDLDRTPRNSMPAPSPTRASPSRTDKSSSKIPGGRLLFVAPPDVSRRSLDELQRDIHGLGLDSRSGRGTRVGLSVNNSAPLSDEPEAPHSAPVNKTTFGNIDMDLKVAKGRTRPMSLLPPSTTPLDSPRSSSRNASPIRSPGLTPQPPPKSELRRATPTPPPPVKPTLDSPAVLTSVNSPLPTIVNTPNTPDPQSRSGSAPISPSTRAAVGHRSTFNSPPKKARASGTMQDLTDMLGGAIDEIGLVNSRDLPPPGIAEPPKDMDHHLILKNPPPRHSSMANAMMMDSPTTISPTATHTFAHHQRAPCSQGSIGLGLGAVGGGAVTMGSVGGVAQSGRGNVSRHVRKASSILSLRTNNFNNSPTVTVFAAGAAALPPAVLFGNIKALKTPGERARAYEKSSSDLFSADSGLRDIYMTLQTRANPLTRSKMGTMGGLGVGTPSIGLTAPSIRNISGNSEFPMRADAYTARELSVRNMEPGEDPNALPPNLPFPALQLSAVGPNTLKTSASAQSIASTASKRTGFLSAFGRLKKEKEVTSLGPPTGSLASLSNQAQSSKRDLRTSSANSGSGGSRRNSVDSTYDQPSPVPFVRPQPQPQPQPQKQPTKAVPRPGGPRGPSEPPVRSSLEAPRPLGSPVGRASLDSPTGSPSRLGGLGGPRALGASSMPSPLARSQNHINHGTSQSQSQSHGHSQSLQSFQIQTPTQSNTPTQPQGPDGFRANEDDVRQFNELVPHAQRPVVRAYLQRYGEMSFAMSAYLEDEKKGCLMRA